MNNLPIYIVKSDDNLWSIAHAQLGDGNRYMEIVELNQDRIQDPNTIYPGSRLNLPASAKIAQPPPRLNATPASAVATENDDVDLAPPAQNIFDIDPRSNASMTSVCLECDLSAPCCLYSIKLKCSHGTQLELPLGPDEKPVVTLVADLGEDQDISGRCVDTATILLDNLQCNRGKKDPVTGSAYPLVTIEDKTNNKTKVLQKTNSIRLVSPKFNYVDN